MAALKFLLSFVSLSVFLFLQVDSAVLSNDAKTIARKNLVIGSMEPQDRLLFEQKVEVDGKPGQVVTEDVYYWGFAVQVHFISAIEVDGSQGGTAVLYDGQLGDEIIGLRLTSAVGAGMKYMVTMYGN